jgi:hypothetical protein
MIVLPAASRKKFDTSGKGTSSSSQALSPRRVTGRGLFESGGRCRYISFVPP